LRISKAHLSW